MARPRKPVNITWLGEDHLHFEVDNEGNKKDGFGPSATIWNGVTFPKGQPVEVTNPRMIEKAKGNQFFEVEGHVKDEPETD